MRSLLVRLADTDEVGGYVRRSVSLAELEGTGSAAPRQAVLETFVSRRLLDLGGGSPIPRQVAGRGCGHRPPGPRAPEERWIHRPDTTAGVARTVVPVG